MVPMLVIAAISGFVLILIFRSRGAVVESQQVWRWALATVGLLSVVAGLIARRRFISLSQAWVRLESGMRLNNALTMAAEGRSNWPAMVAMPDDGWRWRWQMVGGPFALLVGALALALWLPVAVQDAKGAAVEEPQAWGQMEDWLEKLQEEQIVIEEEKEEQLEKIADLRDQPPEKWFAHESLNAGDTLKEQLQRETHRIGQNLTNAERSLNALQNYADQLSADTRDQLLKDYDQALADLKSGTLDIDPALLKALAEIDPKNLKNLSQDQLKKLRESMKKKAGACDCIGENPGFLGDGMGADDAEAALHALLKKQGQGTGPGKGGINRGPGTAPLTLSDEENDLGTDKLEPVSNPDLSRAQVADLVGVQNGAHEVDKTIRGTQAAGTVQNAGQGGQQVWQEVLTPSEKAVLKRVFR